jgi:hypothetical protein
MRIWLVLSVLCFSFAIAKAQSPVKKPIDTSKQQLDTLGNPIYINLGKEAGRKAFQKSLMFPGLGQIYNYGLVVKDVQSGAVKGKRIAQKLYIIGKLAGIYAGGTFLVMSYTQNRSDYKETLSELQYRQENGGKPKPGGRFENYPNTEALNVGKNIYKRNSQVVLISLVGLYALNAIDAYVTARLKFFNIDNTLGVKVSPSMINSNTMYGFSANPSLKLTFRL